MNHPGPEIGQFHGFVVGNLVDDRGFGHTPRVTAHHAVHVRPYVNGIGREQGRANRRRIIAAVTAQGGLQAVRVSGDVAGDDDHAAEIGR